MDSYVYNKSNICKTVSCCHSLESMTTVKYHVAKWNINIKIKYIYSIIKKIR